MTDTTEPLSARPGKAIRGKANADAVAGTEGLTQIDKNKTLFMARHVAQSGKAAQSRLDESHTGSGPATLPIPRLSEFQKEPEEMLRGLNDRQVAAAYRRSLAFQLQMIEQCRHDENMKNNSALDRLLSHPWVENTVNILKQLSVPEGQKPENRPGLTKELRLQLNGLLDLYEQTITSPQEASKLTDKSDADKAAPINDNDNSNGQPSRKGKRKETHRSAQSPVSPERPNKRRSYSKNEMVLPSTEVDDKIEPSAGTEQPDKRQTSMIGPANGSHGDNQQLGHENTPGNTVPSTPVIPEPPTTAGLTANDDTNNSDGGFQADVSITGQSDQPRDPLDWSAVAAFNKMADSTDTHINEAVQVPGQKNKEKEIQGSTSERRLVEQLRSSDTPMQADKQKKRVRFASPEEPRKRQAYENEEFCDLADSGTNGNGHSPTLTSAAAKASPYYEKRSKVVAIRMNPWKSRIASGREHGSAPTIPVSARPAELTNGGDVQSAVANQNEPTAAQGPRHTEQESENGSLLVEPLSRGQTDFERADFDRLIKDLLRGYDSKKKQAILSFPDMDFSEGSGTIELIQLNYLVRTGERMLITAVNRFRAAFETYLKERDQPEGEATSDTGSSDASVTSPPADPANFPLGERMLKAWIGMTSDQKNKTINFINSL